MVSTHGRNAEGVLPEPHEIPNPLARRKRRSTPHSKTLVRRLRGPEDRPGFLECAAAAALSTSQEVRGPNARSQG